MRIRRLPPLLVVAALLVGCSSSPGPGGSSGPLTVPTAPPSTTTTTLLTGRPIAARDLGVSLDEDGRPYDAVDVDVEQVAVETEPLTTLVVPDGEVRTLGGEYATYSPEGADPTVSFGSARELDASVIWESLDGSDAARQVLGIRLDVPGSEVAAWQPFETAYGTDGGTGAVVSSTAVDGEIDPAEAESAMWEIIDELEGSPVVVADRDGTAGDDVIVFSNGWGDGGFPMSRGFDAAGETVALVIWDTRYPWRLAVPDGTPPVDVTEREDELQDCMAGTRGLIDTTRGAGDPELRCSQD